jgi:hypothetical protein
MGPHIETLSDGAATSLIIAAGAGGSFALVVAITWLAVRRSQRTATGGRRKAAPDGGAIADAYPPQPYSPDEPRSHRPYSRPFQIPHQEAGHSARTNGSRPADSTGVPTAPWPPNSDNDN